MRPAIALLLLTIVAPATAQIPLDDDAEERTGRPATDAAAPRQPLRSESPDRQTVRTAYGYRLTVPDEDDYDPTDRRVLRRLNTRLNNRLETRIERYRFVDTKSERAGTSTRNPYERNAGTAPSSALSAASAGVGVGVETDATEPAVRRRLPEDPR